MNANTNKTNATPHDDSTPDPHTPDETARGCLVLSVILIALTALSVIAILLFGSPE